MATKSLKRLTPEALLVALRDAAGIRSVELGREAVEAAELMNEAAADAARLAKLFSELFKSTEWKMYESAMNAVVVRDIISARNPIEVLVVNGFYFGWKARESLAEGEQLENLAT